MKSIHQDRYALLIAFLILERKKIKMTQTTLATKLGKPQSYIAKIEGKDRKLDILEFIDYCEALELMPDAVIQQFLKAHKDNPVK